MIWLLFLLPRRLIMPFLFQILRVLMVVAVDTQQLPVTAVRGIVIVVVILVMDRELTKFFAREFAPTIRADPRKHPERLFPIAFEPTLSLAPSLGDDVQSLSLCTWLLR